MRKYIILSVVLFWSTMSFSQQYCFDSIPDELRKHADAIIRSDQCVYRITGIGTAVEKVKIVVTIVNEKADNYGKAEVFYDDFSKVNYLRGAIYDEAGNLIKTLGIQDVTDRSVVSAATFYSDDRVKRLSSEKYRYPYTFEYEYEKEYKSILHYPAWAFQSDYNISVQKSGIQFIVPGGIEFRYYEQNLDNPVDSVLQDGRRIYTWQEENLKAVAQNNTSILFYESAWPLLLTAPTNFEYGGVRGSMNSWRDFGKWNYELIKGQDVLSSDEVSNIKELVKETSDKAAKVKILYEYMQSRTRYVSIRIGIGGWKPASAEAVSKNGFGDCKGLANYMKAILSAAGIESFYTLVSAGVKMDKYVNFVSASFNHVILSVPVLKDTVWLECTSQDLPFNYLGNFTDDRFALLVTDKGGVIVKTPKFSKEENLFTRGGEVTIYENGAALLKMTNTYSGSFYDISNQSFSKKSVSEMRKILDQGIRFYNFSLNSVSYNENKNDKPFARFVYSLSVNDMTTKMQDKLFFNPAIDKSDYIGEIKPVGISVARSEIRTDSVCYYLPVGYKPDYIPEDINLKTDFGQFICKFEVSEGKVLFRRHFELDECKLSTDKFQQFRDFINAVAKADDRILILSKSGKSSST